MQQIAYLMSAITNQNASNNGQMVQDVTMGMGDFLIQNPNGQRKIEKICIVGDAEVLDMGRGNA